MTKSINFFFYDRKEQKMYSPMDTLRFKIRFGMLRVERKYEQFHQNWTKLIQVQNLQINHYSYKMLQFVMNLASEK